ncbi:unnamed protein product [Prorocentrum cordatum]|nr:unnamed protein product [Polarella glacialis]
MDYDLSTGTLFTAMKDGLTLWAVKSSHVGAWGRRMGSIPGVAGEARGLAWMPGSKELVAGLPSGAAVVFDVEAGEASYAFQAHREEITSIMWLEESRRLITASKDKTVNGSGTSPKPAVPSRPPGLLTASSTSARLQALPAAARGRSRAARRSAPAPCSGTLGQARATLSARAATCAPRRARWRAERRRPRWGATRPPRRARARRPRPLPRRRRPATTRTTTSPGGTADPPAAPGAPVAAARPPPPPRVEGFSEGLRRPALRLLLLLLRLGFLCKVSCGLASSVRPGSAWVHSRHPPAGRRAAHAVWCRGAAARQPRARAHVRG